MVLLEVLWGAASGGRIVLLVIIILIFSSPIRHSIYYTSFLRRAEAVNYGDQSALDRRGHALGIIFGVLFSVHSPKNEAMQL